MSKVVFTMKLDAELRDEFMAIATEEDRPIIDQHPKLFVSLCAITSKNIMKTVSMKTMYSSKLIRPENNEMKAFTSLMKQSKLMYLIGAKSWHNKKRTRVVLRKVLFF